MSNIVYFELNNMIAVSTFQDFMGLAFIVSAGLSFLAFCVWVFANSLKDKSS